ncbi:MAG: nucleoside-diphosphate-sugar epimerase [Kiritimatiellia bacterium]|jgi:nucleoside-diphosphate-sugar epimerase
MTLEGKRIAITGVTGFIGSNLARHLLKQGAVVTGGGRKLERARELEESGATLVRFDMDDVDNFATLCEGQDMVLHVAAWMGGADNKAVAHNVEAPVALAMACGEAGVQRLVMFSSVSAYGSPPSDRVTESTPLDETQADAYGRTKAIGERMVRQAAQEAGIELVIVRPAMVYGPGSPSWTIGMFKMIAGGTPSLFGKADGHAYPVYIDNLVDAVARIITADVNGEAFHFADTHMPWTQWFGYYATMSGQPLRRIPLFAAKILAFAATKLPLGIPLTPARLGLYQRKLIYDTSKARDKLQWQPVIDIEQGMLRSEAWLREVGRLPRTADGTPLAEQVDPPAATDPQ